MPPKRLRALLRKLRAHWRDTLLLLRQFSLPLLAFALAVLGGGYLYYRLAQGAGEPADSLMQAVYLVMALTFFQPAAAYPRTWYLGLFYFAMPLIGIGILAQGVADFGVLFFNRRARGKEWEMAVASTFNHHIILVGLGHLGYNVIENLMTLDQDLVVIEQNPAADLVAAVRKKDIPVIQEDAKRESTLEAAGVQRARAILLCTQNDTLNLQIALKARSLNPHIQVVLRIFDDDFAQALQKQFQFIALSATGMAAPAFAAAASGVEISHPITIDHQPFTLARLKVAEHDRLNGMTVGDAEARYEISVVLLRRNGQADFHPHAGRSLEPGDLIAVFGGPHEINLLIQDNSRSAASLL